MAISLDQLAETIVHCYTWKGDRLMSPTYGVLVRKKGRVYALSVAHTIEERRVIEVWSGLHDLVAESMASEYGVTAEGQCLGTADLSSGDGLIIDPDMELVAMPLEAYDGIAFDGVEDHRVGLLQSTLIGCLDYDPDDSLKLQRVLDAQAGLVEREEEDRIRLSAVGKEGMSGAPVFVHKFRNVLGLVGLYEGTPTISALTTAAIHAHASILKLKPFLRSISAGYHFSKRCDD